MPKTSTKPKRSAKPAAKTKPGSKPALPAAPRQPGVERRKNHPTRAKNGHMQVLLTQSVPYCGQAGELVKVRPGFARNYLLPQGLATFATPHNLRIIEKHRVRLRQLEEARRATLKALAEQIARLKLFIQANANPEGHLYGSVNADQIAASLRGEHFPVEPENVRIEGPLKETGQYTIRLHLGQEIETEFELWVVPTGGDEATEAS